MFRPLFILIPLALVYAGVKVWHLSHPVEGKPVPAKVEPAEAKRKEKREEAEPEVVVESWVSGCPAWSYHGEERLPYVRSAESGFYQLGEISARGMVEGVRFPVHGQRHAVIRCRGVHGPVFVIVTERVVPVEGDGEAAEKVPGRKESPTVPASRR